MSTRRVLVVGTTSDYVDLITQRRPQRALFITDAKHRAKAAEPPPPDCDELLCDLTRPRQVVAALRGHLHRHAFQPSGIACFDCESMSLAESIARSLGLSYPSAQAVTACRCKYLSKTFWQRAHLPCPRVRLVAGAAEAVAFMSDLGGPVVLKPLTGSGGELVFLCRDKAQCAAAFETLRSELADHPDRRMYAPYRLDGKTVDPRTVFVAEEFIAGDEYSCDFTLDGDAVTILRVAAKTPDPSQPFGTTLAYLVPADLPDGLDHDALADQLRQAAAALGLQRAICMLDFVVRDGRAHLIELTPRPGGDCLPPLLIHGCGMDMLGCAIDFAEGLPVAAPAPASWRRLAAVRLFATRGGRIARIDPAALRGDRRVIDCRLTQALGHRVVMPPKDYASRILGYAVFRPTEGADLQQESLEIAAKLHVQMEAPTCATIPST